MTKTLEFYTYRHFFLRPDHVGYTAVHEDYDGPEDKRIFNSGTSKEPEESLIYEIDMWYEDQERSILQGLVGLFQLLFVRSDMPSMIRTAIETNWRYQDALDFLDSSRGTVKRDSEEGQLLIAAEKLSHGVD